MANEKLSKELIIKLWDVTANAWETVARTTSYSFEVNKETIDVTSFDSDGWKEFLVDLKESDLSGDSLVLRTTESGKINYEELLSSLIGSDTLIAVQLINPNAASLATGDTDTPAEAKAYAHEILTGFLTSLSLSGSVGEKQTFSWAVKPSGKVTLVKAVYHALSQATTDIASYSDGDVILALGSIADGNTGYYYKGSGAWNDYEVLETE